MNSIPTPGSLILGSGDTRLRAEKMVTSYPRFASAVARFNTGGHRSKCPLGHSNATRFAFGCLESTARM
jgi:hypothetical protein